MTKLTTGTKVKEKKNTKRFYENKVESFNDAVFTDKRQR